MGVIVIVRWRDAVVRGSRGEFAKEITFGWRGGNGTRQGVGLEV